MIRNGDIETFRNMKKVIFLIKLNLITVLDYRAYVVFVEYSRKFNIIKLLMKMITGRMNCWVLFEKSLSLNKITYVYKPKTNIVPQTKKDSNLTPFVRK